jgi:sugar phosphate isomerase/epimerase
MRIGLFTDGLSHLDLATICDMAVELGIEMLEIGTGNFSPSPHCDLDRLLEDDSGRAQFQRTLAERGLTLSALNCSGNLLHPDEGIGQSSREIFRKTVLLAEKLGLDRVVTMSGCPGTPEGGPYPNWVTLKWPPELARLLDWQWESVIVPFWREQVVFAQQHGVGRVCLEVHPGMAVYNTATLKRLRQEVGSTVGANFDPSHFFWQGMDPVVVAAELAGAVYHSHAKDTRIDARATAVDGILSAEWPEAHGPVSWWFTTIGYGHDSLLWRRLYYELRRGGYDDVLSIEYEDPYLPAEASIARAADFLREVKV